MQSIDDLLIAVTAKQPNRAGDAPASAAAAAPTATLSERALVTLWQRLEEMYPYRWSAKMGEPHPGNSAFTTWRHGLQGLAPAQLGLGLKRCLERACRQPDNPDHGWPPTLPEFVALCQISPADLGLPEATAAFRAACQQQPDWNNLHPIIWQARAEMGAWELTHEPAERLWPRFKAVYQRLVQRALAGEKFVYPPELAAPRLAWEKPKVITAPGAARAHVQHLLALLRRGRGEVPVGPTTLEPEERQP